MRRTIRFIALGGLTAAGTLLALNAAIPDGPSISDCTRLWNAPSNADARRAAVPFELASVRVWDTKAGHHCTVHLFSDVGGTWASYVSWVDRPQEVPDAFGADASGVHYGGDELGGETPWPANGVVRVGGQIALND